jgi:hypothetical protein
LASISWCTTASTASLSSRQRRVAGSGSRSSSRPDLAAQRPLVAADRAADRRDRGRVDGHVEDRPRHDREGQLGQVAVQIAYLSVAPRRAGRPGERRERIRPPLDPPAVEERLDQTALLAVQVGRAGEQALTEYPFQRLQPLRADPLGVLALGPGQRVLDGVRVADQVCAHPGDRDASDRAPPAVQPGERGQDVGHPMGREGSVIQSLQEPT